jgi:two-component system, cell cycle sensor histidine kinase and response regulator CckA
MLMASLPLLRPRSKLPSLVRALYLEALLPDFDICLRALQGGNMSVEVDHVKTQKEFRKQLERSTYDVVLANYRIPGWTGLAAFHLLRSMHLDTPFVLVTESLGDELAVECIQQGISDYILKDNLVRLPTAVSQAIQRKEADEALRWSEADFRLLVNHALVGIYRASVSDDRFLAVNPALVKMLGYASAEEVLKLSLTRDVYLNADGRKKFLEIKPAGSYIGLEVQWKQKDGSPLIVKISGRPIHNAQGEAIIHEVVAEDITRQKSCEQQLWQSQKLEAVGRLAGGVAHDFNNLLTVVNGCAELALYYTADARVRKYSEQIIAAVTKASLVTRQLLTFSRKQVFKSKVLDLNVLLRDFVTFLPHIVGENVEINLVTAAAPVFVEIDKGQTEQVIMNLVVNARDAMPNGGKLAIETATVDFADGDGNVRPNPEVVNGCYVTLTVTDTGTGMDQETRSRIFEPYFTTKEAGKGTGLGLATVFGIVKQAGGFLAVDSKIGKGTTFSVYFPRIADLQNTPELVSKVEEVPRGSETILLVEDEAGLRTITKEFLESIDYTVLESGNGAEALAVTLKHEGPIHLILTDLVMPGIRGPEIALRFKKSHPTAKVVVMSGYSDPTINANELTPDTVFLEKPFNVVTLAQQLRKVLDGK